MWKGEQLLNLAQYPIFNWDLAPVSPDSNSIRWSHMRRGERLTIRKREGVKEKWSERQIERDMARKREWKKEGKRDKHSQTLTASLFLTVRKGEIELKEINSLVTCCQLTPCSCFSRLLPNARPTSWSAKNTTGSSRSGKRRRSYNGTRSTSTWGQCYKTFYVRNSRMFVIS